MTSTPSQSRQAHNAIHAYRIALDDAQRAAQSLVEAAQRASAAARTLQPLVNTPIPAIEWRGAPPVAEWNKGLDDIIPEIKAGLAA